MGQTTHATAPSRAWQVSASFSPALQVLNHVCDCAISREWVAGALLWMAAANSYPDYDGTTIYLRPAGAPDPPDAVVLRCITECCAKLAGMPSEQTAPPPSPG